MPEVIAIACDTEYTSWDRIGGDMLSAGFVEILDDYTLGRQAVFYAKPRSSMYFTDDAQKVHGFSLFKAMTFPDPKQTAIHILQWLAPLKHLFQLDFVNHANGHSDLKWLIQFMLNSNLSDKIHQVFSENKAHNTIKMAKENIIHLENYKLETIAKYFDLELNNHEALSDAIVCAQIYCKIMKGEGVYTGRLL